MCDNSSTIKLAGHKSSNAYSHQNDGTIRMMFWGTRNQVADVLTKPLKLQDFEHLREQLGVCKVPLLN